ncbi:glr1108 [Gloeobacter violaceus PCC 7421]|uniref:Glr1108 protein n=1 Tax=Gloeobacter violaceus (strain ATCC 29082 / PCC 7421) TaxID=251221 RepID=Q7NLL5_GLOVI|nr:glr1108 [Gloeobacter violaceus PCC 7421]
MVGDRWVEVIRVASRYYQWNPTTRLSFARVSFGEFRDRIASEHFDGPRVYLQDDVNNFPALKAYYREPQYLARHNLKRTKLWVSGAGLVTPLHFDAVEVLHWMMEGRKRFVCFHPGLRNFYPHGILSTGPFNSQVNADAPDLRAFPRFRRTQPIEFVLQAGEVLYIPAYYWHQVESLDAYNASMSFIWLASMAKNLRYFRQFGRCSGSTKKSSGPSAPTLRAERAGTRNKTTKRARAAQ